MPVPTTGLNKDNFLINRPNFCSQTYHVTGSQKKKGRGEKREKKKEPPSFNYLSSQSPEIKA